MVVTREARKNLVPGPNSATTVRMSGAGPQPFYIFIEEAATQLGAIVSFLPERLTLRHWTSAAQIVVPQILMQRRRARFFEQRLERHAAILFLSAPTIAVRIAPATPPPAI